MLKRLVNEAFFTLRITTTGPLLIRSWSATISGPDMTPVLAFRAGQQEIFLPGSSLKGVFRSHSEKVVCSLKPQVVCYPFSNSEKPKDSELEPWRTDYRVSCGARFTEYAKQGATDRERLEKREYLEKRTDLVYRASCPACRLYGSTGFIGRVAISDAYLAPSSRAQTERRDGVGIDRLTGGASHGARFELEVVSRDVIFETGIHLRNFEIWQLGILFVVLQDMEDELIHIGSGRSRGLGKVTAQIDEQGRGDRPGGFVLSSIREEEAADEVWGLGHWLDDESYGTRKDDLLQGLPPVERVRRGIRSQRAFTGEALKELREASIKQFIERIQDWPEQEELALVFARP